MRIFCFWRTFLLLACLAGIAGTRGFCLQDSAPSSTTSQSPACVSDCRPVADDSGPAQSSSGKTDNPPAADNTVTVKKVFLNLPGDQKAIWTSPFHLHTDDAFWLAPLLGTTGVLIGSDQHSMQRERSNALAISRSNNAADGGLGVMVGVPALMFAWGSWQGKPQMRETGLLSGEAVVDSLVVDEAFKVVFARERPQTDNGRGKFFTDIGNSSFPSTHSMLSWTAASVIAHEYPGVLPQALAYAGATAVSIARVTGRQHFPADVVVGGAMGWLIGRQVYNAHHDTDLDGASYGQFIRDSKEFDPAKLGSPYVPLDSWVYPALERLAALGYIKTQFTGLRPWTRAECMRQIEEAEYFAQDMPADSEVASDLKVLREHFAADGQAFETFTVESLYTGYTNIAGTPLRDSYHTGATLWNNQGRPYDQGNNFYEGGSVSAVAGRFFMYARGEFEHAPGRPALTAAQQNAINSMDVNVGPPPNPVGPPPAPIATTDRFYPLDMYAGVKLGEYAVTFGKQSLWLGPGETGPLMLSDNADPMYMLRLTRTTPLVLPWFLRHLGEIRGEFLMAKLSGHQFPARPFFNLQKISFHPTQNLEIGFTRASLWGGVCHPFTLHALERNLLALGDTPGSDFCDPLDIGDRKSGFDFSYHVPGLRKWLTVYSDMYSDDDPSPLANPRRAAVNPGFYVSHLPGLPKLDFRGEVTSTQSLTATDRGGTFLYWNFRYHDSNTNKGFLFGNQTGRDGRTYQAWTTWHFSPSTSLQFGYRDTKQSNVFITGGGTQSDASTHLVWQVRPQWSVDAFVQYERWFIPLLKSTAQNDVTGSLQITYSPHLSLFSHKKTP